MGNTNFCGFCGVRNVSSPGVVQRFCVSCGKSFTGGTTISASPTPAKQSFSPRKPKYQEEDDEELEFPDGLPELRASDVIIEGATGKSRFTKIGELSPYAEIDGPRIKSPQEISAEDFKAQWKNDAGSNKRGISVEIGE